MEDYKLIKGYLALAFMDYLDKHKPATKMCLSNMECADIDNAFDEQNWNKLRRYIEKYFLEKY